MERVTNRENSGLKFESKKKTYVMKALKICAIVVFGLFFTATITAGLWFNCTPEGQDWFQEWKAPVRPSAHHTIR